VLQLESIRLQQREEAGEWEYQPSKGVGGEEHELIRPHVGEQDDPTLYLVLVSGHLPANQLP
jgi:hypothetical protein